MQSEPPLIDAHGLARSWGSLRAVDGIDMQVARGEILGLLGPNGAGKTTTMRMLCGALAPTAGSIRIAGIDLLEHPRRARQAIGYLPEQPPVYPDMTVAEYLRFCAGLHRLDRRARNGAIDRAIERCGLADVRHRLLGHLSKGYRQRAGIAQAILHDPEVIIFDEPTSGLDPLQIRGIRDLIVDLGSERAVILSTHVLPEVQAVCTRVQVMHGGRVVFSAPLDGFSDDTPPATLLLEVAQPPELSSLNALDGVRAAEPCGHGRFRLWLTDPDPSLDGLAGAIIARGWGLRALTPERPSLEQVFVDVTTGARDREAAA